MLLNYMLWETNNRLSDPHRSYFALPSNPMICDRGINFDRIANSSWLQISLQKYRENERFASWLSFAHDSWKNQSKRDQKFHSLNHIFTFAALPDRVTWRSLPLPIIFVGFFLRFQLCLVSLFASLVSRWVWELQRRTKSSRNLRALCNGKKCTWKKSLREIPTQLQRQNCDRHNNGEMIEKMTLLPTPRSNYR